MTDTVIDFIRHGEPEGGRCFRGHSVNDPLSENGWGQMWAAVVDAPEWSHIISSPLRRCRQFAELLADRQGISVAVDDRYKEVGFGCWEGRSPQEIKRDDAEAYANFYHDPAQYRPAGAESWDEFMLRVSAAFNDVSKDFKGQHVLVVAHAGVIRAAVASVLGLSAAAAYRIKIGNAGLSRFRCDGDNCRVEYINRVK